MDDKVYTHIFYDIYNKVLQLSEDPSQFAEYLTLQIRELIGTRTVVVAIKTEIGQTKIFSVYPQRRNDWASQSAVIKLAEHSFHNNSVQYLDREKCDNDCSGLLTHLEIEKIITIPLKVGNTIIGSILLLDIMDDFGIESVIHLLDELSGVFALVIRNAYLYHEMENLVTIRTAELQDQNRKLLQSEQELQALNEEYQVINEELTVTLENTDRINKELVEANIRVEKSELQAREILQTAMDGFWLVDLDGRFKDVNEVVCKMLGYEREELLAMNISDVEYMETADEVKQRIAKIQKTGKDRFETKHLCKNGNIIDVEASVVMQSSQDLLVVFTHDITNRKLAEEKLKESEEKYKLLFENAGLGIGIFSSEGLIISFNQVAAKFMNRNPEDFIGKSIFDLYTKSAADLYFNRIQKTIHSTEPTVYEDFVQLPNEEKWFLSTYTKIINSKNKVFGIQIISQDITILKTTEIELQKAKEKAEESEGKLKEAQHIAHMGNWELNIETNELFWSDEIYRIFDCEPQEFKATYEAFLEFIHPDDREKVNSAYSNSLETKKDYQIEHRLNTKNNQLKYVREKCKTTFNEQGKPLNSIGIAIDITEQKALENELIKAREMAEENKQKFKSIADTSPLAIHISKGIRQVAEYINPTFHKLFGYEYEEVSEVALWWPLAYPDKEYRKQVSEQWNNNVSKAIQNKTGIEPMEVIVTCKDGTKKNILWGFVSTGNENWAFGMDLTSYRTTEQELIAAKEKAEKSEEKHKEKHNLLSNFIKHSPIYSFIKFVEPNLSKVVYASQNYVDMTGIAASEMIDKTMYELFPTEFAKKITSDDWEVINNGKILVLDEDFNDKNYTTIKFPIVSENKKFLAGFTIDITERKKNEIDLIIAKEKAEESDRLKSAFLATMSHEIRTPMNGILGFTELLREPDLSSEQKEEYINIVNESGQRMLNTVNDIVEISKIEAGIVTVDLTEVDVQLRLNELIRFFIPEVSKKGLKLILENEVPKAVALISTDQNKIDSILTNLIKNAIKFTKAGEIRIGCIIHGDRLEFYVKDTGIGIPTERQQAVFERFIKADILDKDASQGSGLGLSIAKAYVEMLGGEIRVESKINQGSTFFFTLPLIEHIQEEKRDLNQEEKTSQIKGLNIVIAEDDEISALYLQTILQTVSSNIILTKKGNETVNACRNNPGIDLVLMDIQMPEINGYEATRQIREFNKDVVIIAQTAYALSGDREKAINAGCNDYISKPIKKNELQGIIQKYFGN